MSAYMNIRIPEWLDKICVWPLIVYRRLKFGEPFRKIDLGEGAYTIVDPDVYYEKSRYKWIATGKGKKLYAVGEKRVGPQKTKRVYLHREIIRPKKDNLVDHRDNNPLNNLRSNLRQATHSQNMMNSSKKKNSSSKYRGVHWSKFHCKWVATISRQRRRKHLGLFVREIDAAHTYDIAAIKYHKDFANTNFPREDYVKTRAGYKFAGDSRAAGKNYPLKVKLCKIFSSILGRLVKHKNMKGRVKL